MKILQVISRFDFGGAENYVRELSNELVNKGHTVIIISKKGRQTRLLHPKVRHLAVVGFRRFLIVKIIFIIYQIKKNHIEIIHAHQRLPILAASIAGFITGIPVIVTVHGRVRHDLRSILSRRIPKKIIFVSQQVLNVSKYFEALKHKSIVIPNGVPLPLTIPEPIPFNIGYLSRIDSRHSLVLNQLLSIIIILHQEFPKLRLIIYGEGSGLKSLWENAHEINKQIGYEAVVFQGFIENYCQMKQAPELFLAVGRVAIEASIRGISVISINQKRMGHLVTFENYEFYKQNNFVNIIGEPPNREKLLETIQSYFRNREQSVAETSKLRLRMTEDFIWSRICRQIEEVYLNLKYTS